MTLNPDIMRAVEQLNYRATVGDVAAQAGVELNLAQQGLLALASDARGHLQVAESGEVVYQFPRDFRTVLRNKYLRLRLQEWWEKVWRVLFYLIRISFAILLLLSLVLIFLTIILIITYSNSNRDSDDRQDSGGGSMSMPNIWFGPDFFWVFYPDYYDRRDEREKLHPQESSQMNFLEAVFSFLFGDGNPNMDLEDRRWQAIATTIRNNRGAIVAEQIAPYLDDLGQGYTQEYEDYMLPVLTRFNGRPEVSPEGALVYHFPELQTTVSQSQKKSVPAFLQELPWRFSRAGSGQLTLAAGLGVLNFVGALWLGGLLGDGSVAAEIGGLVAFVQSIYWLLLGYGTGFLVVPLIRYFWVQQRNRQQTTRNENRQARAAALNQGTPELQQKLAYARQFAAETVIRQEDLIYSSDRPLLEQEVEQSKRIDAEWERRLNQ